MTTHTKKIIEKGASPEEADKVVLMLHGRGAPAEDIISLHSYLQAGKARFMAPEAAGFTWYPYSFMAPRKSNEPWLSDALKLLSSIEKDILDQGFTSEQIYIVGFSQGACLATEFAAQNAKKYGGIAAFTGGLIGEKIDRNLYNGNFENTPVFLGNSDSDPHIPVSRSEETREVYNEMGANVTLKIYANMPHTIIEEELNYVNENIFGDQ